MTIEVAVKDMTCQGCESVVETAVGLLDGVETVEADRYDELVRVEGNVDPEAVVDKIELAGYTPAPTSTSQPAPAAEGEDDDGVAHDVIDEPASGDGQAEDG